MFNSTQFQRQLSAETTMILCNAASSPLMKTVVKYNRAQFSAILENVRNLALEWSLTMQRNGILGEGMSFTSDEQSKAQSVMTTINNQFDVKGNIIGNAGGGEIVGNINVSEDARMLIASTTEQLTNCLKQLNLSQNDTARLKIIVDALVQENSKKEPENSKLKELLTDTRNIVSGAAGNLVAEGTLAVIGKILSLL